MNFQNLFSKPSASLVVLAPSRDLIHEDAAFEPCSSEYVTCTSTHSLKRVAASAWIPSLHPKRPLPCLNNL